MAMANEIAILFDASKCSGCKGCQVNCKQWNQLPAPLDYSKTPFSGSLENPIQNDGDTWLRIRIADVEPSPGTVGIAMGRDACKHCAEAPCVSICPSGACHKEDNGSTVIDAGKCIGCKYCVAACPFKVPHSGRDGKSKKCWLCQDRLQNDRAPACVSTCPTGALQFGSRDEMVTAAKERAAAIKDRFPSAVVYGIDEMGGLGVISVLPHGAEAHGEPKDPQVPLLTKVERYIPPIMGIGALGMLGVTLASFMGGRGSSYDADQYRFDPKTGVSYDNDKPMDPDAPVERAASDKKKAASGKGEK
ncbi:MAG: 4Fe-4S dicluster domain-containing protein [Coriobacteriia bacterium]|nr:4Fe-4S dicluster domain-containing protein [Coriobacteriia bacterium]